MLVDDETPSTQELEELAQTVASAAIAQASVDEMSKAIALLDAMLTADVDAAHAAAGLSVEIPHFLLLSGFAPTMSTKPARARVRVSTMLGVLTLLVAAHTDYTAQIAATEATRLENEQIFVEQQIRNELEQRAPELAKRAVEQAKVHRDDDRSSR
jgi:hypothetical protein